MNFCPKCRKKLVVQDFCVECGADLTEFLSNDSPSEDLDTFDFSALQNANEMLIAQSGLVIENGILTGYTGKKISVLIPRSVEEIFDKAFYNNDFITDVEIENGPSVIGKSAFSNCRYLKRIKIPKSVTQIGEYAFYGTGLDVLYLDEYSERILKSCLSSNAIKYLSTGTDISSFIKNENGCTVISIRELECQATAYFNECKRKEEEERRRRQEEERRKYELLMADIGKIWTFGSYYINSGSRKEPIQWIVVARQEGRAMLVSKDAIACKKYNETNASCCFGNSTLHKWLISDFFNEAFSSSERARILTIKEAGEKAGFDISFGKYTGVLDDKIFLLNKDNMSSYLKGLEQRQCKVTPFASGSNSQYYCNWWLDSSAYQGYGRNLYYANIVKYDGSISLSIDNGGGYVILECGVRPAMWINVE